MLCQVVPGWAAPATLLTAPRPAWERRCGTSTTAPPAKSAALWAACQHNRCALAPTPGSAAHVRAGRPEAVAAGRGPTGARSGGERGPLCQKTRDLWEWQGRIQATRRTATA